MCVAKNKNLRKKIHLCNTIAKIYSEVSQKTRLYPMVQVLDYKEYFQCILLPKSMSVEKVVDSKLNDSIMIVLKS